MFEAFAHPTLFHPAVPGSAYPACVTARHDAHLLVCTAGSDLVRNALDLPRSKTPYAFSVEDLPRVRAALFERHQTAVALVDRRGRLVDDPSNVVHIVYAALPVAVRMTVRHNAQGKPAVDCAVHDDVVAADVASMAAETSPTVVLSPHTLPAHLRARRVPDDLDALNAARKWARQVVHREYPSLRRAFARETTRTAAPPLYRHTADALCAPCLAGCLAGKMHVPRLRRWWQEEDATHLGAAARRRLVDRMMRQLDGIPPPVGVGARPGATVAGVLRAVHLAREAAKLRPFLGGDGGDGDALVAAGEALHLRSTAHLPLVVRQFLQQRHPDVCSGEKALPDLDPPARALLLTEDDEGRPVLAGSDLVPDDGYMDGVACAAACEREKLRRARRLAADVGDEAYDACAEWDALHQVAASALRKGWLGEVVEDGDAIAVEGLWPYWMRREDAVPLSFELRAGEPVVLTGPHAAGKSSLLRSLCAVAALVRAGLPVPAARVTWPRRLQRVVLRNVSFDDAEKGLSSWQVECREVAEIMQMMGQGSSLVCLDEVGRGTEPRVATGLNAAVADHAARTAAFAVICTHLPLRRADLPALASFSRMRAHRVEPGVCDDPCALDVAVDAGMPDAAVDVIARVARRDHVRKTAPPPDPFDIVDAELQGAVCCPHPDLPLPTALAHCCCIYLLDVGGACYVGETADAHARMRKHERTKPPFTVTAVWRVAGDPDDALHLKTLETRCIRALRRAQVPMYSDHDGNKTVRWTRPQ